MTAPVDLARETLLTLAQAARRFPPHRQGRPVCSSTVWRWCRKGVRVPGGEVVRLECVRVAGKWLTSVEAISRFVRRQTPAESGSAPAPRTPGARRRAAEGAGEELRRLGV